MKKERGLTDVIRTTEWHRSFSSLFRAMQRPELRSRTKVDGGGARMTRCVARRKKARKEEENRR